MIHSKMKKYLINFFRNDDQTHYIYFYFYIVMCKLAVKTIEQFAGLPIWRTQMAQRAFLLFNCIHSVTKVSTPFPYLSDIMYKCLLLNPLPLLTSFINAYYGLPLDGRQIHMNDLR